jgi:hypothetical protein
VSILHDYPPTRDDRYFDGDEDDDDDHSRLVPKQEVQPAATTQSTAIAPAKQQAVDQQQQQQQHCLLSSEMEQDIAAAIASAFPSQLLDQVGTSIKQPQSSPTISDTVSTLAATTISNSGGGGGTTAPDTHTVQEPCAQIASPPIEATSCEPEGTDDESLDSAVTITTRDIELSTVVEHHLATTESLGSSIVSTDDAQDGVCRLIDDLQPIADSDDASNDSVGFDDFDTESPVVQVTADVQAEEQSSIAAFGSTIESIQQETVVRVEEPVESAEFDTSPSPPLSNQANATPLSVATRAGQRETVEPATTSISTSTPTSVFTSSTAAVPKQASTKPQVSSQPPPIYSSTQV